MTWSPKSMVAAGLRRASVRDEAPRFLASSTPEPSVVPSGPPPSPVPRLVTPTQAQKCKVLTVGQAPAIIDVHDGDTFRAVLILEGQTGVGFWPWLRLDGCDAYELSEPGGTEAQEWAVSFLQVASDIDVYLMGWSFDRRVARVIVDGVDMSIAIIAAGHAVSWKRPS